MRQASETLASLEAPGSSMNKLCCLKEERQGLMLEGVQDWLICELWCTLFMKRIKDTKEYWKEVGTRKRWFRKQSCPVPLRGWGGLQGWGVIWIKCHQGQESFHNPLSNTEPVAYLELTYVPITPPYVCCNNKTGEAANKRAGVSGLELVILLPTLWSAEIADVYHHTQLLMASRWDLWYSAPVYPSGSITSLPYGNSSNK